MESFRTPPAGPNRSDDAFPPPRRRRRRRWARRLLARLRGPWLLQSAAVLLFAILLGLLAVLLLDRW